MTAELSEVGYRQTCEKLASLEQRLAAIQDRTDIAVGHRDEVVRSYREMISQYLREIKLYEAKHPPRRDPSASAG